MDFSLGRRRPYRRVYDAVACPLPADFMYVYKRKPRLFGYLAEEPIGGEFDALQNVISDDNNSRAAWTKNFRKSATEALAIVEVDSSIVRPT